MHDAQPTEHETVREMLAVVHDQLVGDRPSCAEVAASHLCSIWFASAPALQRCGMASHPLGEWPNVAVLRLFGRNVDAIEHASAGLALVRALHSLYPNSGEAIELSASLETQLLARGAAPPSWSLELDAWRLEEAFELIVTEPAAGRPAGDMLITMLHFVHPCGDQHGMSMSVDAHNYNHIHAIDVFDDFESELALMRREIDRDHLPLAVEPARNGLSLACSVGRSIKKTYMHEFEPLRHDSHSMSSFPLLCRRSDAIEARESARA